MPNVSYEAPDFEERQKLELRVHEGALKGKYITFVVGFAASQVKVEVPSVNGLYLPLKPGQSLHVEYRKLSARYQFDTRVLERDEKSEPPLMSFERPERVKRIQLRDNLRVPCSIDANVVVEGGADLSGTPSEFEATVVDLSAGGLKLQTDVELPVSTRINIQLRLPVVDETLNNLYGRVVRAEIDELRESRFLAVEFEGLLENQRKALVQYSYRRQLELKKDKDWVQD